jgi:hypothetical protein
MQVRQQPSRLPRMPEYDDEYEYPYLGHGNMGWNDTHMPKQRPNKLPERQFPFGFGIHASQGDE